MNKFNNLYDFIDIAKNNRKYPENTANNLKSALKIFEKALTGDELNSLTLLEDRVEEIFINVINNNKNKSIISLNTYKARLLKVLKDFKKYGEDPSKIQSWQPRLRQGYDKQTKKSTPLLIKKDKEDKIKINLSDPTDTPVHKIELALRPNAIATIFVPNDMSANEAKKIKSVLDSLIVKKDQ